MDLPTWEGTRRAVPPPLGSPPPVGKRVSQGSMMAVSAMEQEKPVAGKPRQATTIVAPRATVSARPVGPPPGRRLPIGVAVAVAVGGIIAIAATAVAMRSSTPARTPIQTGFPSEPPVSPAVPSPISQALANLSGQPMLRYSGLSPDGRSSWQLTITAGGEAQGDIDLGDGKLGVLEVGGRTYVEAADPASAGLLGELPSGVTATSVRGKWVTGDSAVEALVPSGLASAGNLAASLRSALPSQDVGVPSSTASSTRVNGESAVPVTTSAGVLYISTAQPYRVLRFVPSAQAPGQPTEVETLSQSAATHLSESLVDQTRTLTGALDLGIAFTYGQGPKLSCTGERCTVEASDIVASAADPAARPMPKPPGTVVADVTAVVTVEGQSAGQCEVVAKLPLDQLEDFSCQVLPPPELQGGVAVNLRFEARAATQDDVNALIAAEQNELLLDRGRTAHTELG